MQFPIANIATNRLIGMAKIMRLAFNGDDLSRITSSLGKRIETDSQDAAALMDLSVVLQVTGRPQLAIELQTEALQLNQIFELDSNPRHPALKLLVIMGPGEVMANTPIEFLVEESDISLSFLYLGEGLPIPNAIPEHDLAFVAVCESDQSQFLLAQLDQIMRLWPKPFINSPARIAELSRNRVSERLASADGIVASCARRLNRLETRNLDLQFKGNGSSFPVIARPVNSHAGHGLCKLDDSDQVAEYLETQDSNEFFVAAFIDYRSKDGLFRKYRIAVIDGQPFAAHMAISHHWMVHYLNADMLNNAKNRDTEAEFMLNFDGDFGARHRQSLAEIDRRIGLDYYSIDCAETSDGRLLVFELDNGAVVHSMDSVDLFPYKAPQMESVFAAFRKMLRTRANQGMKRMAA